MTCRNCKGSYGGGCGGCGCFTADDCAVNIQDAIDRLKELGIDYCRDGLKYDAQMCESIGDNKGLKGNSTTCADLQDALTVLIGDINNRICSAILCNEEELRRVLSDLVKAQMLFETLQNCAICGLWEALEQASYLGVGTLLTTTRASMCGDQTKQLEPAFNNFVEQSNLPDSVLTRTSDYKGIIVNNTTVVPLLVNSTFNCSITTDKLLSSAYIVVTRDGNKIGQTPFITPTTYDQQVAAEPFILQPGQSTTLRYYMRVGAADSGMVNYFGGSSNICCVLEPDSPSPDVQRSYFNVSVSSVLGQRNSTS